MTVVVYLTNWSVVNYLYIWINNSLFVIILFPISKRMLESLALTPGCVIIFFIKTNLMCYEDIFKQRFSWSGLVPPAAAETIW